MKIDKEVKFRVNSKEELGHTLTLFEMIGVSICSTNSIRERFIVLKEPIFLYLGKNLSITHSPVSWIDPETPEVEFLIDIQEKPRKVIEVDGKSFYEDEILNLFYSKKLKEV